MWGTGTYVNSPPCGVGRKREELSKVPVKTVAKLRTK